MKIEAQSVADYVAQLPEDRQEAMEKLRQVFREHLPEGFAETLQYGMIGYVVPHSLYPDGYHCDPKQPVPFVHLASQKNHIAVYHMGLYAQPELQAWFAEEYPKHSPRKLDQGKSCIRFKKPEHIPFALFAQLAEKMTAHEWIALYEKNIKR